MPDINIRFGRLVRNVSEPVLPLELAADMQNVDIDKPGEVTRRQGYQHTFDTQLVDRIALCQGFEDRDGTQVFITIDGIGVHRI